MKTFCSKRGKVYAGGSGSDGFDERLSKLKGKGGKKEEQQPETPKAALDQAKKGDVVTTESTQPFLACTATNCWHESIILVSACLLLL